MQGNVRKDSAFSSLSAVSATIDKCTVNELVVVIPPGTGPELLLYRRETNRFVSAPVTGTSPTGPVGPPGANGATGPTGTDGSLVNTGPTGPAAPSNGEIMECLTFTQSQNFTIPANVRSIYITCQGGGGGGDYSVNSLTEPFAGGSGGGMASLAGGNFSFAPGDVITLTIGAGGIGSDGTNAATPGAPSTVSYGASVILQGLGGSPASISGGSGAFGGGGGGGNDSAAPRNGGLTVGSLPANNGANGIVNGFGGTGGGGGGLGGQSVGGGGGGGGSGGGAGGYNLSGTGKNAAVGSGAGGGGAAGNNIGAPGIFNGGNGGSGSITLCFFPPSMFL